MLSRVKAFVRNLNMVDIVAFQYHTLGKEEYVVWFAAFDHSIIAFGPNCSDVDDRTLRFVKPPLCVNCGFVGKKARLIVKMFSATSVEFEQQHGMPSRIEFLTHKNITSARKSVTFGETGG